MPSEFTYSRRVQFRETDAAGIMHFSQFFVWMEEAEHAFFRSLGLSIHEGTGAQHVGWPRVSAQCDYKAPLRFEDEALVQLRVCEKRAKSLSYEFIVRRADDDSEVASGALTAVCVAWDENSGRMKAVNIPPHIADKIEVAASETE
jgi:acyl-CoA thioester hydrolase